MRSFFVEKTTYVHKYGYLPNFRHFSLLPLKIMLGRNIRLSYNSGRMLWKSSNVDRKFVCINAAMNQSTDSQDITDVQVLVYPF